MSKKKKKRLDYDYTDSINPKDQQRQLDELLYIQQLVENGKSVPSDVMLSAMDDDDDADVDVPDMISSMMADAVLRLDRNANVIPVEPVPLVPISKPSIPTLTPLDYDGDDEDYGLREMIPVKHQDRANIADVETHYPEPHDTAPAMRPKYDIVDQSDVEANDADDQDLMSFEDFVIVLNNDEDCVITVRNPYTDQEGVSINTFCLRGYTPVDDDNYRLLKSYLPLMMSMLAGPALIIEQTFDAFKRIIHGALSKHLDPKKVMIFTSPGENTDYFIVYIMDSVSRSMVMDAIIPQLEGTKELTHFVTVVCDLMSNEMLNPLATGVSNWLQDYLEESVTNPDIAEDFCRIVAEDQGYDNICPDVVDMKKFIDECVLGDIAKFISTTRQLSNSIKNQMSPNRYVEPFIDGDDTIAEYNDELDTVEETISETASVSTTRILETQEGIVLNTEDIEVQTKIEQETVEAPIEKVEVPPMYKREQETELVYKDPEGSKSSGIIIDVS